MMLAGQVCREEGDKQEQQEKCFMFHNSKYPGNMKKKLQRHTRTGLSFYKIIITTNTRDKKNGGKIKEKNKTNNLVVLSIDFG